MKFKSKQRNFLALTIASLIFPTASFAVDDFSSCNALLTAGIYNTSQSSNNTDSESLKKSTFCSADYSLVSNQSSSSYSSAQSAQIKASYGLFSGGAGGSSSNSNSVSSSEITAMQKNVCTSGFDSSKYSSQASQFGRNVYQGSLDAWNNCQKLAQKGVNFDLQVDQSMQGAIVTISPSSSGSTVNFNGLDQIGLGRSICTTTRNSSTGSSTGKVLTVDKTTSLKVNSGSLLTITCERQMSSDSNGQYADAQTLVFNTSAGSYQVPMVTIGLSPRVAVDQAVAILQSDINSKFGSLTGLIAPFNSSQCPAGWKPADGTNGTPDLRGEFVRGLDNGRGVDNERTLAGWQAPTITTTAIGPDALHQLVIEGSANSATIKEFNDGMQTDSVEDSWYGKTLKGSAHNGSTSAYSGNSAGLAINRLADRPIKNNVFFGFGGTRPRNVALLYCVKN